VGSVTSIDHPEPPPFFEELRPPLTAAEALAEAARVSRMRRRCRRAAGRTRSPAASSGSCLRQASRATASWRCRVSTLSRSRGIPRDARGFVPVDRYGHMRGVEDVYAAGDVTSFPVSRGVSAQQGEVVARAIAARAGAPVRAKPFDPTLRAIQVTGNDPLYLRAEPVAGVPQASSSGAEPLWWPPAKIARRYLAPFLAAQRMRSPA
jgi:hypothetical protein